MVDHHFADMPVNLLLVFAHQLVKSKIPGIGIKKFLNELLIFHRFLFGFGLGLAAEDACSRCSVQSMEGHLAGGRWISN
jgi:hypothetical protein